jgi:hypothetical protein
MGRTQRTSRPDPGRHHPGDRSTRRHPRGPGSRPGPAHHHHRPPTHPPGMRHRLSTPDARLVVVGLPRCGIVCLRSSVSMSFVLGAGPSGACGRSTLTPPRCGRDGSGAGRPESGQAARGWPIAWLRLAVCTARRSTPRGSGSARALQANGSRGRGARRGGCGGRRCAGRRTLVPTRIVGGNRTPTAAPHLAGIGGRPAGRRRRIRLLPERRVTGAFPA